MSHVGWFLRTNEKSHLKKFVGKSVADINGTSYVLEARPDVLLRLLHAGGTASNKSIASLFSYGSPK